MDWLKNIRKDLGMTQLQVGEKAGITQQHYNFIETGARRPSVETAKKIAAALGFEWTRFFEDDGEKAG